MGRFISFSSNFLPLFLKTVIRILSYSTALLYSMNDSIADPAMIASCIFMSANIVKLYMYFDAASDMESAVVAADAVINPSLGLTSSIIPIGNNVPSIAPDM